jgi:death-on-curing family protein
MPGWMLGADYLEYIHDALVALLWPNTEPVGDHEQRDRSMIESASARPFHSAFYEDAYISISEKAIALFHSINANHAFTNGNKRTAVIAVDHFLLANDHCLVLPNEEMYKMAEKTASYKKRGLSQEESLAEIRDAISKHVFSFSDVEKIAIKEEKFVDIMKRLCGVRDLIRANPANSFRE